MLWQAVDQFRFKIAGGFVGPYIPPSYLAPSGNYHIIRGYHLGAAQAGIVRSFIAEKRVTSVVVAGDEADFFAGALRGLATPLTVGGVVLYRLSTAPAACPGP